MILSVKSVVGEFCMTREDGQKLHDRFRPLLDAGEVVTLDFAGTHVFVSAFFNTAVGQLLATYSRADLAARLRFANVPTAAVNPLNNAIDAAEKWHKDPSYRATLTQVLTDQAIEA